MKKNLTAISFLMWGYCLPAQNLHTISSGLPDSILHRSFQLFYELLSLPNDAHNPADIEKNIQWCEANFSKRGFSLSRLSTKSLPLLLAERKSPNAQKTILIYLQLDGQPVSGNWSQESPWKPELKRKTNSGQWEIIPFNTLQKSFDKDWRIFARSVSDAKGPVAMFLTALDFIEGSKMQTDFNIKVIMDFEEEIGSPALSAAVDIHREKLAADWLLIFDGPQHISNKPTLIYGARGIATIRLETFGPAANVHSGHYGNFIPNPAQAMAGLLAGIKNDKGVVLIRGFYDGIHISSKTKKILATVPDDDKQILRNFKVGFADRVASSYQESLQYPSLNIRGLSSGWVGKEVRTIIPSNAIAELDIRLVPASDPEKLIELIKNYITDKGFFITENEPTDAERLSNKKVCRFTYQISYPAFDTPFENEITPWLLSAFKKAFDGKPIIIKLTGGSVPISPFVNKLKIPAVIVPTVNPDNNQHSDDENIRLGNYIDGIKLFINILTEKL